MQNYALFGYVQNPFIKIILLFFCLTFQPADSKAQNDIAKSADSLFIAKDYKESAKLYELIYKDSKVNNRNISLKLAYIYENEGNFPKTLYYLNSYYNANPNDEVFDKMNKIALVNKYSGYERDNINFIFAVYQQFYIYILYGLIAFGGFLLVILYRKKLAGKKIYRNNWMVSILYILLLVFLVNIPSTYKSAIIKNRALLRSFPSSAAEVVGEITPGNKINIIGSTDIWQKAYYNSEIVYVNQNDVWLLEN